MGWKTVERPGQFGRRRDQRRAEFDERYGPGDWRVVWRIGRRLGSFAEAVMVYEDAYCQYLADNTAVREALVSTASDVYDNDLSNIASGFDYAHQESDRDHIQDVAIRRCLVRLGEEFRGREPLQIRHSDGSHPLSLTLSPGRVPFHRPEWLIRPEIVLWWAEPGSVESFYQSNKLLQRRVLKRDAPMGASRCR